MATPYQVKPGETLFGITKRQFGLPKAQEMYRDYLKWLKGQRPESPYATLGFGGKAETLPAGFTLTIPSPGITPGAEKEVRGVKGVFEEEKLKTLGVRETTPEEIVKAGVGEAVPGLLTTGAVKGFPAPETWQEREKRLREEKEKEYKVSQIEADIEEASGNIKTFLSQKPDTVALFNKEYKAAGLENTKTKIEALDIDITQAKRVRDQTLLTEEGKPIPQWMITGRRRMILNDTERTISNLIDERNSLTQQYNQNLNEVTAKVGMKQEDTKTEAQRLQGLLDLATGKYERVQKRISEILRGEREAYEGELERLTAAVTSQMIPAQIKETEEGEEKDDIEWAEEFVTANPDATYEELFPYLKIYTKMSDTAVKNFLISKGKKPTEEESGGGWLPEE